MFRNRRNWPGKIPHHWLDCPETSSSLVGGKFLVFKTPLDPKFDDQLPNEKRFHPKTAIRSMESLRVKIGLWIDLTYTNRYYDPGFLKEREIRYYKLASPGGGETISPALVKTFNQVCDAFIEKNPLKAVVVHCTHGFNRTGFFVCCYLVEKCDWVVGEAVASFAKARPPGIYREEYLQELFLRYGDVKDTPSAPPMPDWCTSSTNTPNPHHVASHKRNLPGIQNAEAAEKKSEFLEGVSGVTPLRNRQKCIRIQRKVQEMCAWKRRWFPGTYPVSMDRENISLLSTAPYKVSWKADGTRYMMLIDGIHEIYFVDQENRVFSVKNLFFPKGKESNRYISDTLVDGEMVIDELKGKKIPRYLIFDIICFEGNRVGQMDYDTRLTYIRREIVEPRQAAMTAGITDKGQEPFEIQAKDFYDLSEAKRLLGSEFLSSLAHQSDGLVFQPVKEPYTPGACKSLLKWKPASANSVDFRLTIVDERKGGLVKSRGLLFVGGKDEPFGEMEVTLTLRQYDNKIIECKFQNQQWVFMRERINRSFPNSFKTAKKVFKSISNPVTEAYLLNYIDQACSP
ncbi:unnamed protein product [Darwinula stevensoni]|uniref:mRNA-capping enzyme n=1 Tax=Darwinula stevensoni TaxID=69355 RepID=A0A7R9AFQ3_9CRUS|nr:unnamed protein product [Darwinula stevensoni]CAG0903496.1 unnamed protein product [Darwinula stevensoni]